MFSIVCVYNKKDVLESVLLPSLKKQTSPYELVLIDNTKNQYASVAAALNAGGAMTRQGKYIMFVHQDVSLPSATWLDDSEKILDRIDHLGIAGVWGGRVAGGKDFDSHLVGYVKSGNTILGKPLSASAPTQTVDELLFIIPRKVFNIVQFDNKTFDFIHLIATDYCLRVSKLGFGVYVIPGYVEHKSTGNFYDIDRYRIRLARKFWRNLPIFTTCGEISLMSLPKFLLLSILPKRVSIYLRNFRNKLKGKNIDTRGFTV